MSLYTNLKKTFVVFGIVLALVVPSLASAVVDTQEACAQPLKPGQVVRVPGVSDLLYYITAQHTRMYFAPDTIVNAYPHTFLTWYADFSSVGVATADCMLTYPNDGSINYRPGSRIVQVPPFDMLYIIEPGNVIREIYNPNDKDDDLVVRTLYGHSWKKKIVKPDGIFTDGYTIGEALTTAVPHDGMLIRNRIDPNKTVYLVQNGMYLEVVDTLPSFLARDVHTLNPDVFNTLPLGGMVSWKDIVKNPTQK